MRIKFSLLGVSLLWIASVASADSLSVGQIAQELKQDAVIPLAPSVGNALALNLLAAQRSTWGSAPKSWQVGSLSASEESVLRAIGVYVYAGGPSEVTFDETFFWLVWAQSRIAINVNASGGFDRTSADFGEVAVAPVATPEPQGWILILAGLVALASARVLVHYFFSPRMAESTAR